MPPESDTRTTILTTARQLLDERGLAGLSMRDVARRAGVTHQAPYHHFADRESILAALVEDGFAELTAALGEANDLASTHDARQVSSASGTAYIGFALNNPGLFRVMFRTDVVDPVRFPAVQRAGDGAFEQVQRLVVIIHGEQGDETMALLYWSLVHGLATLAIDGPLTQEQTGAAERDELLRAVQERFISLVQGMQPQ